MHPYLAEFLGTAILILMGVGVCANSNLNNSYGKGAGWVVITFGWGFGVFLGVIIAGPYSGAHINPAVSIGLAVAGKFPWVEVAPYILAQLLGACVGAFLAWFHFADQYNSTDDQGAILGTFCTGPAIKKTWRNLMSEVLGTFILIFVVLFIAGPSFEDIGGNEALIGLGSIGALPVALLVVAIGMSLGGTTGYAINPARDLSPRFIHSIVPIHTKGKSNWAYAWIPIVGPVMGATIAGMLYLLVL